jgi:transcriptional regulator with XRE-family HTH domain
MERLRELRLQKKISQQQLADILHVTQQSIYKYEHGIAEPDLDIMIAMAGYFDTSVDYLIGYSDVPIKYELYDMEHSLTPAEHRLLTYYRSLSSTGQQLLLELLPSTGK